MNRKDVNEIQLICIKSLVRPNRQIIPEATSIGTRSIMNIDLNFSSNSVELRFTDFHILFFLFISLYYFSFANCIGDDFILSLWKSLCLMRQRR